MRALNACIRQKYDALSKRHSVSGLRASGKLRWSYEDLEGCRMEELFQAILIAVDTLAQISRCILRVSGLLRPANI